jgi:toxin-antitoxin system PIN domain toxin
LSVVLFDVNVLVYAHRGDAGDHVAYRRMLETAIASAEPFGLADLVSSGFLRVVTHPKVFRTPTPMAEALKFVQKLSDCANAVSVSPGPRHFEIFTDLCRLPGIRGNLVPDAFFAALAIESGCEWITADRGFARFPGLRWRHPLG